MEKVKASEIFMELLNGFNRKAELTLSPQALIIADIVSEQFKDLVEGLFIRAEQEGICERNKDFEIAITCVSLCRMLAENMTNIDAMIQRELSHLQSKPN